MSVARRPAAQFALLVTIGAMFLGWQTGGVSVSGTETGEGQLAALVSLATIVMIAARFRPAWIGAAFVAATLARPLLDLGSDAGIGLWIGTISSAAAVALLIWEMFATIPREPQP